MSKVPIYIERRINAILLYSIVKWYSKISPKKLKFNIHLSMNFTYH